MTPQSRVESDQRLLWSCGEIKNSETGPPLAIYRRYAADLTELGVKRSARRDLP
jgi:hypothetical protein